MSLSEKIKNLILNLWIYKEFSGHILPNFQIFVNFVLTRSWVIYGKKAIEDFLSDLPIVRFFKIKNNLWTWIKDLNSENQNEQRIKKNSYVKLLLLISIFLLMLIRRMLGLFSLIGIVVLSPKVIFMILLALMFCSLISIMIDCQSLLVANKEQARILLYHIFVDLILLANIVCALAGLFVAPLVSWVLFALTFVLGYFLYNTLITNNKNLLHAIEQPPSSPDSNPSQHRDMNVPMDMEMTAVRQPTANEEEMDRDAVYEIKKQ